MWYSPVFNFLLPLMTNLLGAVRNLSLCNEICTYIIYIYIYYIDPLVIKTPSPSAYGRGSSMLVHCSPTTKWLYLWCD